MLIDSCVTNSFMIHMCSIFKVRESIIPNKREEEDTKYVKQNLTYVKRYITYFITQAIKI